MKKVLTFSLFTLLGLFAVAQTVTLTFTGRDADDRYVQLNRVVVTNYTRGWQKTLFWPDTALTLRNGTIGIVASTENSEFALSQNNPNPFGGSTEVNLTVSEPREVTLAIANINGNVVKTWSSSSLQKGTHQFRITLDQAGTYVMTAQQNGKISSIKMLCNEAGGTNKIEHQGITETQGCTSIQTVSQEMFRFGDQMEYVGYATIDSSEVETHSLMQTLNTSETIPLQLVKIYKGKATSPKAESEAFRVALSLSPFSPNQFDKGYSFVIGDKTASTPEELQQIYRDLGSTEMYVRIATKRHVTDEDVVDGKPDENANVHTFDQGIRLCQIAAALDIPINPEIMCAYTYMDMDRIQAPRFEEYPEIYALQNGKKWSELSLDEICVVLEAYGEFVADAILETGCTVRNWNLGNEANFGFAGVGMGAESAVDEELGKASAIKRYTAALFSVWWMKKHVWNYNAKEFAAVKNGILRAYFKRNMDVSNVKFSTHIATVTFTPRCCATYFKFMAMNGYAVETAGISYYPSAPALSFNKKKLLTKTVARINKKCKVPVFIGEFSYPSGKMSGPFASWNKKVDGYNHDQKGQADMYSYVVSWGKQNGMAGIRYWAPDYEGWYAMSMFEFSNKVGTAKTILKNHKKIVQ